MADEDEHQARESQTLEIVRPVTDVQGQPTRVTPMLDDADVKFRDALEEALKPIDPQPNPTAKDRRKGLQYAYDAMYREHNRDKSSQILVKLLKTIHWYHSDYILLIYCQANLLMATFELSLDVTGSLGNVLGVTNPTYRAIVDSGYNCRCCHDGYRFTAEKLREFQTLMYGLEKRIEREKDVETVQEEVKREWKKMIKLGSWTHVNRMRVSPEMKERFRQMLREKPDPPYLEYFYLHTVEYVTMTWAVRLTDEWLQKTTGCRADDFIEEVETEEEDEEEDEEEVNEEGHSFGR
ncbi:MAG: hypothetical protein LQ341_006838 [Variospora aurantia]|nr:MAG: hypothetical protein LQ341_006838 [Variospora aurantia]